MVITKPMLAGKCTDINKLKYPVLATPKLDGIRCLVVSLDGIKRAVSRNFKPIPNHHVRSWIESNCPVGFDGELVVPNGTFQQTTSAIMSREGTPEFEYQVFDWYSSGIYAVRVNMLYHEVDYADKHLRLVLPKECRSPVEVEEYEGWCLQEGYEGVMVRTPDSPYKCGRSTEREGYLLKIKRFEDSEAIILECIEKMHNDNPAELDELGRTKRSSHKANQIPMGVLGALTVKDLKTAVSFQIGSGFDDATRESLWRLRETLPGKIVKYRYQSTGVKDKPRFPTFLGMRSSL